MSAKQLTNIQKKMVDFCRKPSSSLPKIDFTKEENVSQYPRLIRIILSDTIISAYPITQRFISEENWEKIIEFFICNHTSEDREIWKLPKHLLGMSIKQNWAKEFDLPFLDELLEFEWLEIDVFNRKDTEVPKLSKTIDLEKPFFANPDVSILIAEYPIHKYNESSKIIENKGTYIIFCYRRPSTLKSYYLEVNPWLANLFVNGQEMSTMDWYNQNPLKYSTTDLQKIVQDLIDSELVLGYKD